MNLSWRVTALFLKILGPWQDMPCVKHAPRALVMRSAEEIACQERYRLFLAAVLSNKLVIREVEERYHARVYSSQLCCMIAIALMAAKVYGEDAEWFTALKASKPYLFEKVIASMMLSDTAYGIIRNTYTHGFYSHAPYNLCLRPGEAIVPQEKTSQLKSEWYSFLRAFSS